jgi:phthiodiolone/phenolphthiodiolone dimycocerosates ketoreductase
MSGFKVGLADQLVNARYSPTALVRASYLTAVASRVDSLWVIDHLNSLMPRAICTALSRWLKSGAEQLGLEPLL